MTDCYARSSTLWKAAHKLWATGGVLHSLPQRSRRVRIMKSLSRGYERVVHSVERRMEEAERPSGSLAEQAEHLPLVLLDAGLVEGVDAEEIAAHGYGVFEEVEHFSDAAC